MTVNVYSLVDRALVWTACCATDFVLSFDIVKTVYTRFVAEVNVEVRAFATAPWHRGFEPSFKCCGKLETLPFQDSQICLSCR